MSNHCLLNSINIPHMLLYYFTSAVSRWLALRIPRERIHDWIYTLMQNASHHFNWLKFFMNEPLLTNVFFSFDHLQIWSCGTVTFQQEAHVATPQWSKKWQLIQSKWWRRTQGMWSVKCRRRCRQERRSSMVSWFWNETCEIGNLLKKLDDNCCSKCVKA